MEQKDATDFRAQSVGTHRFKLASGTTYVVKGRLHYANRVLAVGHGRCILCYSRVNASNVTSAELTQFVATACCPGCINELEDGAKPGYDVTKNL
jgi:hypothetical protein